MANVNNKINNSQKPNIIVKKGDFGSAVEDVQRKLCKLGYLKDIDVDGEYKDKTAAAVLKFSNDMGLDPIEDVSEKVWAKLVDATFKLGDRNLFLRIPYFHGNDVLELQHALGSLGFQIRNYDGIFGASTERALRRFQVNMGLPSDGIVGSQTFIALKNLKFAWSDKSILSNVEEQSHTYMWRNSEVLENNSICLYGTNEFTRDVATRMSNLARATNPFSKVLCSDAFTLAPDADTMLLHIVLPDEKDNSEILSPRVLYAENDENNIDLENSNDNNESNMSEENNEAFIIRLTNAIAAAKHNHPARISIELPGTQWWDAGEDRSAQHFAITTLDALCSSLEKKSWR